MTKHCDMDILPKPPAVLRVGILVISDGAISGEYEDGSGKAINNFSNRTVKSNWIATVDIVADRMNSVASALIRLADRDDYDLIFDRRCTGPSARDFTPEGRRLIITRASA